MTPQDELRRIKFNLLMKRLKQAKAALIKLYKDRDIYTSDTFNKMIELAQQQIEAIEDELITL